jgi:hypothetical protein
MPGKPKRKSKHPQSKKSKAIIRQGTATPAEEAAAASPAPAAPAPSAERPAVARPAVARPARARPTGADIIASPERYPFYIPELKRIGLLAGIIIVILVVLSLVLS